MKNNAPLPMWALIMICILFTGAAMVMLIKGRVEVEPVRILNPTTFDRPEEVGAILFRRFWNEINSERLTVFASTPSVKGYDRIWKGFLLVAEANHIQFDRFFSESQLKPISTLPSEPVDWEQIQLALIGGRRVLVQLSTTDANWSAVKERTQGGFFVFLNLLPVDEREKEILRHECGADEKAPRMSCQALVALRTGKKREIDPNKLTAVVEKYQERGHLLLLHEPAAQ